MSPVIRRGGRDALEDEGPVLDSLGPGATGLGAADAAAASAYEASGVSRVIRARPTRWRVVDTPVGREYGVALKWAATGMVERTCSRESSSSSS